LIVKVKKGHSCLLNVELIQWHVLYKGQ